MLMDQELKNILLRIDGRLEGLEGGQKALEKGQHDLESGQKETNKQLAVLKAGQTKTNKRLGSLESGQQRLEKGQDELKDMLKHSTTLLTENFTGIRQDIRVNKTETDSDINLLFKKTEDNERDIQRIKRRINLS